MKIYSIWSVTHFIAFGFLWAVPVIFIGLTNMWISRLPNELQILFHLSSLFIDRTESWYENYIQIRTADTSDWVTVRSADYDPLEIFGAGNRITRMLAESSGNGNRGTALRGRIAEFIASKHAMVFPGTSPITEIRFVAAQWPVGSSEFMARPPGRWLAPPLELLPKDQLEVMSSHALAPVAHGSETPVVGGKWLTDTTLTAVLKSRKVIALDLSEATISSKGLQEVFAHPSVQTLNLSAHKLTPADFSGLSKLSALRELDLTDTATSAQGLQELASLTSLKVLKLSRNSLDGTIFNTLGKMKELEVLHLNYCGSGGQALQSIASWPKLRELQIAGAPEVRHFLTTMPRHASLRILNLAETEIADGDVLYLQRLPGLETLHLDHTNVSDQSVGKFRWCPSLRRISLEGTKVTESSLSMFSQATKIQAVYLNGKWNAIQTAQTNRQISPQTKMTNPASPSLPSGKQP